MIFLLLHALFFHAGWVFLSKAHLNFIQYFAELLFWCILLRLLLFLFFRLFFFFGIGPTNRRWHWQLHLHVHLLLKYPVHVLIIGFIAQLGGHISIAIAIHVERLDDRLDFAGSLLEQVVHVGDGQERAQVGWLLEGVSEDVALEEETRTFQQEGLIGQRQYLVDLAHVLAHRVQELTRIY